MKAALPRWLGLLCSAGCCACFGQAPSNDNFTNAIVLSGNATTFSGTVSNATYESGEPTVGCNVYSFPGGSVWWSWTATNSTAVVVDVLQSTGALYAGLSVDTGSDVSSLSDLGCVGLDGVSGRYIRFSANAGTTYHIRAWGSDRSFTLRLTATDAPVIITPPQSQTVAESASVMFGAIAAGAPSRIYQWQFNGNSLPGETWPSLTLHYLAASQAGDYSVVLTNSSGSTTSAIATLTISPTNPPLLLAPVASPDKSHFAFSLAGQTGRFYRIWSTTNLVNWSDEDSLAPFPGSPAVVLSTNATSVYSIPIATPQKSLQASHFMNKEICIANLQAIQHAIKLWAIETGHSVTAVVSAQDITPYLKSPLVCPSGGTTFANSYRVNDVASPPECLKVPQTHILSP